LVENVKLSTDYQRKPETHTDEGKGKGKGRLRDSRGADPGGARYKNAGGKKAGFTNTENLDKRTKTHHDMLEDLLEQSTARKMHCAPNLRDRGIRTW